MKTYSITNARSKFADVVKDSHSDTVQITEWNRPTAAVIGWELYESMMETLEVLSDPEIMKMIAQSESDITDGRVIAWDTIKKQLD